LIGNILKLIEVKIMKICWKRSLIRFINLLLLFTLVSVLEVNAQRNLNLEDALQIAMSNSPDIRRSEYNLEQSSELLNAQNAALKSKFGLSITPFSYSRDRSFFRQLALWQTSETTQSLGTFSISQPLKWTDGTIALFNRFTYQDEVAEVPDLRTGEFTESKRKDFINRLFLSFQQPIFTYNRTKLALKELELNLENTRLAYNIQKLSIEQRVTQSFFDVYRSKLSLEIAQEEQNNQQISYDIIKNKVDAGLEAPEELYQAELNLSTSKSQVQNEQVRLANLLDNFKNLIGIPLEEELSVVADVTYQPVMVDLKKALNHGLQNRMELRQRAINIESARFDLTRTAAENEFKGSISTTLGLIGQNEEFSNIYDVPTKNLDFSVSIDIPLFDWGEKKSRLNASRAVIKTQELTSEEERNAIIIGINQAYRTLQNLEIQKEIAEQNVRNAQLTYDINLERYKNGDLTSMDLNLFQTQLSTTKMELVSTLIDYKLALLDLKIQSLYDFQLDRSVIKVN
jgi:outer membrane protein